MPSITPFLWFDNQAEEAAQFYLSVFRDGKILSETRYGSAGPGPEGSIMTIQFELQGQQFTALNGGPHFKFNEAVSFVVRCETQAEIDYFWEALSDGGSKSQCGWLKDRYGVSWQIVPSYLLERITTGDPAKAEKMKAAMLRMRKLDTSVLQTAYEGAI
ncbi:VOC family protein [bacterium]|nr:VOC family protein [bacterium]